MSIPCASGEAQTSATEDSRFWDRVGCLLFYGLDWLQESSRRRNEKFFDSTIFQKCWRGVGEQPTFAKQIRFCSLIFLLQLHFLKLLNSQFYDL